MVRARKGAARRQAKKRLFKAAKGYRGARHRLLKSVKVAIMRARQFAYRDRKVRKRQMRRLWIIRINAACRQRGTRYNRFIKGLSDAGVEIDRKLLAHLAVIDPAAFDALLAVAQGEPVEA